jgi:proliferating cell nuclear antigen PCNA
MPLIFSCKSREAYSIKILAELLQSNIKTGCFEIDETGIRLRMMDHHRTVLIDLELNADAFSLYSYKYLEPKLNLGINLIHFHKMLKSIKKRDLIRFFIDENSPNDLGIEVIPKENNRVTTSYIKIQNIQNIDIDIPDGYSKPIVISSGEFQKMCKGLTHISNLTRISSKNSSIKFLSDAGGIMKRATEFGEQIDENGDEDEDAASTETKVEFEEDFDTEQLTKISKLAGLSQTMQIYPKEGHPLLFRTNIGTLGKISIYLKSKSMQETDLHSIENEDE